MPKTRVRFIPDVRKEHEAAERWFRQLVQAIYSLEELPERCPLIPEQDEFPFEIRHLIYFSHRIIFRVEREKNRVVIFRVYHITVLGGGLLRVTCHSWLAFAYVARSTHILYGTATQAGVYCHLAKTNQYGHVLSIRPRTEFEAFAVNSR